VPAPATPPGGRDHLEAEHALAPLIQKPQSEALTTLARAREAGLVVAVSRSGHYRLADAHRQRLGRRLPYLRRSGADYSRVLHDLLSDNGEVRPRDLVEAWGISPVQASRVLSQATATGLLVRYGKPGPGIYYTAGT
jgi:hypothetical protein